MIKNFDEMILRVKEAKRGTVVIAAAQTESVLDAAILAKKEGLADSILVGDAKAIQDLLDKLSPEYAHSFEIVDTGTDLTAAAARAVELINQGKGDLILKGKTETSTLLRAVLDKEKGLRISEEIGRASCRERV